MNKLKRCILFIVIFSILYFIFLKIFCIERNPITYFYDEPKNSLDVVYIGSSNAFAHFNTTLSYQKYGFTTGMLSYSSQPFVATEFLIKEAQKYQKPKLYVIDLSKLSQNFSEITEAAIRKVTDSMKNSQNRIDTINKLLSYTDMPKEEYINYYYSSLAYHDAWKSPGIIIDNLFGNKELYKGYLLSNETIKKDGIEKNIWPNDVKSLNSENIDVLNKLLKYINSNSLNVLFVVPLKTYEKEEMLELNYGIEIIKEKGYNVINFNDLDDFSVDFDNDFYNFAHLNVYGATKYTLYFSKYLSKHYNLEDHRGDNKYKTWDKEYNRLKKNFNKLTGEDFDNLLTEYKKMGY